MSAMDRPIGMATFEPPNVTVFVSGQKKAKPAFRDGSWVETFSKIRVWEGVWSKKFHYDLSKVEVCTESCDTQVKWMLLQVSRTINPKTMRYYRWWVAFNEEFNMKALVIEDGTGRKMEFDIVNFHQWKSEVTTRVMTEWRE